KHKARGRLARGMHRAASLFALACVVEAGTQPPESCADQSWNRSFLDGTYRVLEVHLIARKHELVLVHVNVAERACLVDTVIVLAGAPDQLPTNPGMVKAVVDDLEIVGDGDVKSEERIPEHQCVVGNTHDWPLVWIV